MESVNKAILRRHMESQKSHHPGNLCHSALPETLTTTRQASQLISLHEKTTLPAVLRLSGNRKAIESVLQDCSLPFTESLACLRARRLATDQHHATTTFNLTISEADGDCVPVQLNEMAVFLEEHREAISSIVNSLQMDCELTADVSWDIPMNVAGQYNVVSTDLMKLLASLRIELMFSVYPVNS